MIAFLLDQWATSLTSPPSPTSRQPIETCCTWLRVSLTLRNSSTRGGSRSRETSTELSGSLRCSIKSDRASSVFHRLLSQPALCLCLQTTKERVTQTVTETTAQVLQHLSLIEQSCELRYTLHSTVQFNIVHHSDIRR